METHLFAPSDEEDPSEEYNDASETHSLQNEWVEGEHNEPSAVQVELVVTAVVKSAVARAQIEKPRINLAVSSLS